jgi:hypothetical protein
VKEMGELRVEVVSPKSYEQLDAAGEFKELMLLLKGLEPRRTIPGRA